MSYNSLIHLTMSSILEFGFWFAFQHLYLLVSFTDLLTIQSAGIAPLSKFPIKYLNKMTVTLYKLCLSVDGENELMNIMEKKKKT